MSDETTSPRALSMTEAEPRGGTVRPMRPLSPPGVSMPSTEVSTCKEVLSGSPVGLRTCTWNDTPGMTSSGPVTPGWLRGRMAPAAPAPPGVDEGPDARAAGKPPPMPPAPPVFVADAPLRRLNGATPGCASVPDGSMPAADRGCTTLRTMCGVISRITSVLSRESVVVPNRRPATGRSFSQGMPAALLLSVSLIRPASTCVSPSRMRSVVEAWRVPIW